MESVTHVSQRRWLWPGWNPKIASKMASLVLHKLCMFHRLRSDPRQLDVVCALLEAQYHTSPLSTCVHFWVAIVSLCAFTAAMSGLCRVFPPVTPSTITSWQPKTNRRSQAPRSALTWTTPACVAAPCIWPCDVGVEILDHCTLTPEKSHDMSWESWYRG